MPTLPQLIEKDIRRLDVVLREFLELSDATAALLIDKGGFLLTHSGDAKQFDLTTIAALSSGAYLANQTIASLINENNFNSVYQQGEQHSMLIVNVDENSLLVILFRAQIGVGVVKYYATRAIQHVAAQMKKAWNAIPRAASTCPCSTWRIQMWSFGKNPEPRFRNRSARLMAATWHRTGATGAGIAVAAPPMAARSWFKANRPTLSPEMISPSPLTQNQPLTATV